MSPKASFYVYLLQNNALLFYIDSTNTSELPFQMCKKDLKICSKPVLPGIRINERSLITYTMYSCMELFSRVDTRSALSQLL